VFKKEDAPLATAVEAVLAALVMKTKDNGTASMAVALGELAERHEK
jgi:hypothetical protein